MKAIALISGGLDSTLAAKIMQNLDMELVCLNTLSPFCLCNHHSSKGSLCGAHSVAKELGLKLISVNVTDEFLKIVNKPKHGYGSNMNPCIDCRILLFKKAKEAMVKEGASFVITGEVLGQRPMSQKSNTMKLIEKESGLEGLVLRPLSAKVLMPTIPEEKSWVDRKKLLAINGRGRREQFALANEFGIHDYPCPSGGCLLTDPEFSRRIRDLVNHNELTLENVQLAKAGRYLRLSPQAKLAVGRNQNDNLRLEQLAKDGDWLFSPGQDLAGPTALGRGEFSEELIKLSCQIVCRYSDLNGNKEAQIFYQKTGEVPEGDCSCLEVLPLVESQLAALRI